MWRNFLVTKEVFLNSVKEVQAWKCKIVATPLVVNEKLLNPDGEKRVDPKIYISLIGSLLYLTTSRVDIIIVVTGIIV